MTWFRLSGLRSGDSGCGVHNGTTQEFHRQLVVAICRPGAHNRRVLTLTEPQVLTLIGVFAAAIFGVQAIAITSFRREMQSMRNEMLTKFDSMESRFDARFDQLDRDVQFLMRKEFD
jgi:hypothetical protein